jgi:tRNA A-37 threonylcarbamoyl transferase component Bud32
MSAPECVSPEQLRAFLLGELPEGSALAVANHLETCPVCEAAAGQLDDLTDQAISALRFAWRPASGPGETPRVVGTGQGDGAAAPPGEWVGRCVGGNEIVDELGRGGMSVVYKARQARPARLVALKMILGIHHAEPRRRARCLAEADAIARLAHPNIVQVHEVGEHDNLPFLALELMDGGSLAQKLGGVPQPPAQAAGLVQTLARAVHHAHQRGVVHRDLKPANVLLGADGTPKISDFGLAKQERLELTTTGVILGTPSYMAPEQASGDHKQIGPAADIYALGAILYECLTGRPPFRAANILETLEQVRTQEPVSPSKLQARTPRDLNTICLKCLQKEPARRYGSALDLADDLQRFLDGKPIHARPVGPAGRAWRWARRSPALAGLSLAVALLLLALTLGSFISAWRMNRVAGRALRAEGEATDRLFDALVTRAETGRASGRPGQRFAGLEALRQAVAIARDQGRPAEDVLRLRNAAIGCLALPDLRREADWEGNPPGSHGLGFDARFERYALASPGGEIHINRASDHQELFRLPAPAGQGAAYSLTLRFSPDGKYFADWCSFLGRRRTLRVWELRPGVRRPQRPVLVVEAVTAAPAISTDSRSLYPGFRTGPWPAST